MDVFLASAGNYIFKDVKKSVLSNIQRIEYITEDQISEL